MRPGIDRALGATWVVALVMTVALLANVTYVQGFEAQDLRDSSLNARRLLDRNKVERGPIVAGGQRLAWSELTSDGKTYQRHYAYSKIFSPITGYFSPFTQTGLEGAENHFLDGSDSRLATTNLVDKLIGKKIPGGTVETTIDVKAQRAAYEALQATGARRAAAVAIDAETGAILVMASTPSYDANDVSVLSGDKAQAVFKRLNAEPLKPLLNKATGEVYPPGSTFKTIVASTALTAGKSEDSQVRAGRSYQAPGGGQPINNDAGDIGGECDQSAIPLIDAYAQSCNTTFAYMGAQSPGNAAVRAQAQKFGFGDRIEIEDEMSAAPSSFPKTDQPVLSALGSIGQGSTVATPLQMALVAAGVLNDGKIMKPYLVDKLRASSGTVVDQARRGVLARPLTSDQASQMRDLMEAVVKKGTGKTLQGTSVLGGKTGTADVTNAAYNDRWFIGFGPRPDARYAVAVMTEKDGYGIESGPIAAKIIDALGG
ncbi:penicillin-binding transpeptidase domain-containing protein [Actinomadura opuntiae]|uniref:penicillin-binding transpeptidase domain-containing protein n=1 Tax=Actinomadura sp. OS1-43 TaxID=604315 RepID=UPI00255A7F17|nr:penicillin-binding transpeptidase domain-containing protein [Actinomadura sp. OS1-43]MDL4818826.1 penicillin-binding transpeptidase domain-containing protein [Actinomadura sp. OS1-43]